MHHTSEYHERKTCQRCLRTVGIHNWSKRIAPHTCGHVNEKTGRKFWCHACPTCNPKEETPRQ